MSDLPKYTTFSPMKLDEFKEVIEQIKNTPAPEVAIFDSCPKPKNTKSNWEEKEYQLCR
jgi:hypothetical protein